MKRDIPFLATFSQLVPVKPSSHVHERGDPVPLHVPLVMLVQNASSHGFAGVHSPLEHTPPLLQRPAFPQ
jgi:hypothetical protein